jgi:hypothetical protein
VHVSLPHDPSTTTVSRNLYFYPGREDRVIYDLLKFGGFWSTFESMVLKVMSPAKDENYRFGTDSRIDQLEPRAKPLLIGLLTSGWPALCMFAGKEQRAYGILLLRTKIPPAC